MMAPVIQVDIAGLFAFGVVDEDERHTQQNYYLSYRKVSLLVCRKGNFVVQLQVAP